MQEDTHNAMPWGLNTNEKLVNWVIENIEYDPDVANWKLSSPEETAETKRGNCHDQSLFTYNHIKDARAATGQLFFIEANEGGGPGGNTHTLTWFRVGGTDGQIQWLETAWEGQKGIKGFSSMEALKKYIVKAMKDDKDINSGNFDGIVFSEKPNYKVGMELGEYVESWELEEELHKYSEVTTFGIREYEGELDPKDFHPHGGLCPDLDALQELHDKALEPFSEHAQAMIAAMPIQTLEPSPAVKAYVSEALTSSVHFVDDSEIHKLHDEVYEMYQEIKDIGRTVKFEYDQTHDDAVYVAREMAKAHALLYGEGYAHVVPYYKALDDLNELLPDKINNIVVEDAKERGINNETTQSDD